MTSYIADAAARVRARVSEIKGRPTSTAQPLMLGYGALALRASRGQPVTLDDVHDQWSVYTETLEPAHPDIVPGDQLGAALNYDQPYLTAILDVGAQLAAERAQTTGERS